MSATVWQGHERVRPLVVLIVSHVTVIATYKGPTSARLHIIFTYRQYGNYILLTLLTHTQLGLSSTSAACCSLATTLLYRTSRTHDQHDGIVRHARRRRASSSTASTVKPPTDANNTVIVWLWRIANTSMGCAGLARCLDQSDKY